MKKLMLLMGLASILAAKAEILMYEGYPTGENGYASSKASAVSVNVPALGFADAAITGQNFVYTHGSDEGLAFPLSFPSSYAIGGNSAIGFKDTNATAANRSAFRKLSSEVVGKTKDKFYFRCLMQADEKSLANLVGNDTFALTGYYAAGLCYSSLMSTGGLFGDAKKSRTCVYVLGFAYTKNSSGSYSISLIVRGNGDDTTATAIPLVLNPVPGNTYIGLIEVEPNSGENGKEKVRAVVQDTADYNPAFAFSKLVGGSDTVEVEFITPTATGNTLSYLGVDGRLGTAGGAVKFDEFAMATQLEDLVYVASASDDYTLYIASNIEDLGTPSLAYGKHDDVASDGTLTCTPGGLAFRDGIAYSCSGYTYETRDEQGEWSAPEQREGTSFTMTSAAKTVRITWQWAPVAYRVVVTSHGSGSERFTFSVDPLAALQEGEGRIGGYFPANAELQVTAIDGTGDDACEFKGWTGGMTSSERVISVSVAQAIDLTATFTTHWRTLSTEEGVTVTDGNWVLTLGTFGGTIDEIENPLMIIGATAGSGVLDLNAINEEAGLTAPVKAIGAKAFEFRSDLVGLILAPEIRNLYRGCFQQTGIANLPDFSHIVYIEEDAFRDCGGLKGQPDFTSLVQVKNNAFQNTKLSGDLNLPNLQAANYQAFFNAAFDGALVAPKLTEVDGYAFGNLAIKSVEAESLENVGGNAFVNCTQLKTVRLSPTVKSFGAACFQGCTALETIEPSLFAPSVTRIGFAAFRNAGLAGAELVFGKDFAEFVKHNDTDEASEAFSGSKIASADLGATSLAFLRQGLFQNCDHLTRVVLPETLTEIAANVFSVQRADDPMLVIETKGAPPATVNAGWAANRDWKMVIRVPEKAADAWLKDAHFVPLTAIEGLEEKPNYDRIGDYRKVVGAWRSMWLSVDYKGFSVIVR